jgi:hypothetical protein
VTTTLNRLAIAAIRTDGGTQTRAMLNEEQIVSYAEAMDDGAVFPPVTVFYDGTTYWLADGFHRLEATRRGSVKTIAADVRQGTRRDAILFSVGANAQHGLHRSNDDKRRAVTLLLSDSEWVKWSDREIAKACGVSPTFVGSLRPPAVHGGQQGQTRTGKDGKKYKATPWNRRRRRGTHFHSGGRARAAHRRGRRAPRRPGQRERRVPR